MRVRSKFLCVLTAGVLVGSVAIGATNSQNRDYEMTIVHVNDTHGRVEEGKYDGVGMARVSSLAKRLKRDKNNGLVLLVDGGDTLHGTTFATLNKGESIVDVFNTVGFNYATLGNHDFNYGKDRLEYLLKKEKYKTLSANVVDKKTGKLLTYPYVIRDIDGKKVGIFGLTTPETYYKTNPKNVEDIIFADPIQTAKQIVAIMKKQNVDFIILISHLGDDESTEKRYQSVGVAEAVPEINLIIDGHSHTVLHKKKMVNGVAIVQTGEYDKNIGVVKIDLDDLQDKDNSINYKLYTKNEILNGKNKVEEDPIVKRKIEEIKKEQKKITNVKIGYSPVFLNGEREMVRTRETNLSQLITDSILWKTKADVVLTNGGGIRASINKGDITVGNVISVLPFGNYVVTKEITGANLKQAVEHGLRAYPTSLGGMAQVAGMVVKFDPTQPAYKRVKEIYIKGEELDPNKKYIIATNDFMASGGDDYKSLVPGQIKANYPGLDEILIEYIKNVGIKNRDKIEPRLIPIK